MFDPYHDPLSLAKKISVAETKPCRKACYIFLDVKSPWLQHCHTPHLMFLRNLSFTELNVRPLSLRKKISVAETKPCRKACYIFLDVKSPWLQHCHTPHLMFLRNLSFTELNVRPLSRPPITSEKNFCSRNQALPKSMLYIFGR